MMNRFATGGASFSVALWLTILAGLIFVMILVGGATRLTDSGLSITEWDPIMGAIPPLSDADWQEAFRLYRQIPEYRLVNAGMSMGEFQFIFWWEWAHRQLGRLIGVVALVPFVIFLVRRSLSRRLALRGGLIVALIGVQGAVGWWMVASGLSERVDVAPERLTVHLGLALAIFALTVLTAHEAWAGHDPTRAPAGWLRGVWLLVGLIFVQCLLGGLVAGSDAGRVFTDWPLMEGRWLPPVDWSPGPIALLHDQGLVQFMHRLGGYAVFLASAAFAFRAWQMNLTDGVTASAYALLVAVTVQALIGIATLIHAVPLSLGLLHQGGAAVVLAVAVHLAWRVGRSQARLFSSGLAPRGL